MFVVLLALVGSCPEPVATVVKELGVISLHVTRGSVSVRARRLTSLVRARRFLIRGSNISDATLGMAVKAQTVKPADGTRAWVMVCQGCSKEFKTPWVQQEVPLKLLGCSKGSPGGCQGEQPYCLPCELGQRACL